MGLVTGYTVLEDTCTVEFEGGVGVESRSTSAASSKGPRAPSANPRDGGVLGVEPIRGPMSLCRHCGRDAGPNETPDGACEACANSPRCAGCGHERSEHSGAFAAETETRCRVQVEDFQALEFGPCLCEGFRPVEDSLADAPVAASDPDPLTGPPLRLA